jgi:hypothetical protein
MRRTLSPSVAVAAVLTALLPLAPVAAQPPPPPDAAAPTAPAAGDAPEAVHQVADEVDVTTVVPALEARFAERFGGYWIDEADMMHVAVVDATRRDRSAVARIVGRHPRVVTDAVANGYDALVAASDEIAATLDPAAGHFAVGVDVARNAVVVQTEAADPDRTAAVARDAARRGVAGSEEAAADAVEDIDAAVVVEPATAIAIEPTTSSRNGFPPFEAGLSILVYVPGVTYGCTTGFMFRNGFGNFGSTAGHCGPVDSPVVLGGRIADVIRGNGYHGTQTVRGDVGAFSLNVLGWSGRNYVHTQGNGHRVITGKLSNTQVAVGLRLCFEGVTSDGNNCGTVVRANQTLCCDAAGKSFIFSCTDYAGRPGDSGGPVYQPVGATQARAAGMLSSTVTINGAALMCFSTAANLERTLGSTIVTYRAS